MIQDIEKFNDYLREQGLRSTQQRARIAELFLAETGHLSAEDLYDRLKSENIEVGQATVYRTLKHLCAAGLARELHFNDGISRYESRHDNVHHDHLTCEICNMHIEVMNEDIERLQVALARKHGFTPTRHTMNLYGICADCRTASQSEE